MTLPSPPRWGYWLEALLGGCAIGAALCALGLVAAVVRLLVGGQ